MISSFKKYQFSVVHPMLDSLLSHFLKLNPILWMLSKTSGCVRVALMEQRICEQSTSISVFRKWLAFDCSVCARRLLCNLVISLGYLV